MKKKIKIKININGKPKIINENLRLIDLIKMLNIPVKKVAIELNYEILDKKKINKLYLKKNDKVEIVHFIGGG